MKPRLRPSFSKDCRKMAGLWMLPVTAGWNTLTDKISVMRQILRERPNDREALEEEVQWESTARSQSVYYSRLMRDVGVLVIQSTGAQTLIPDLADCPAPATEDRPIGETREYHPTPGKTL